MLDTRSLPIVDDPDFPAAPELLGDSAGGLIASSLATQGTALESLRTDFVLYTPGRGITVTYHGQVGSGDGSFSDEVIVAAARRGRAAPSGVLTAELAGDEVGIWRYPDDPHLPGLRSAADPDFVMPLLEDIGFEPGKLSLDLRTYRPGLRAVIRAMVTRPTLMYYADSHRFKEATLQQFAYLKVLRPGEAANLATVHGAFADLLPAPRCLAIDRERSIVVLEALPGATLGRSLTSEPPTPLPGPDELLGLLEKVASVPSEGTPVGSISDQVRSHVHLLRALAPEESERIERVGAEMEGDPAGSFITVHGDFYDSQVLVREGRTAGLLDLDDVGPGERIDDLATMAGRVWTIAQTQPDPAVRARVTAYALEMLECFSDQVDPDELDRRVGGILLGRATGPFRAQEPGWRQECVRRIRTAEAWLRRPRVPEVGL